MESRNCLEAVERDFERVMQLRDSHGKLCYRCTGCNRCTFGIELNRKKAAIRSKREKNSDLPISSAISSR